MLKRPNSIHESFKAFKNGCARISLVQVYSWPDLSDEFQKDAKSIRKDWDSIVDVGKISDKT